MARGILRRTCHNDKRNSNLCATLWSPMRLVKTSCFLQFRLPRQSRLFAHTMKRQESNSLTITCPALASGILLTGCTSRGAPSFMLFGAYFPSWLLSAIVGVAAMLIAHRVLVMTGWGRVVPLQLWVCAAIGVVAAVFLWSSMTGQF